MTDDPDAQRVRMLSRIGMTISMVLLIPGLFAIGFARISPERADSLLPHLGTYGYLVATVGVLLSFGVTFWKFKQATRPAAPRGGDTRGR